MQFMLQFSIPIDKGLVAGKYLVAITATRKTGKQIPGEGLYGETNSVDEEVQFIPAQFNARTNLTVELTAGENEKEFALQGK